VAARPTGLRAEKNQREADVAAIENPKALGPATYAVRDWTNLKAALYVLAVSAIFTLVFTSGRFAADLASALQIMFLRYVGGFLTISLIAMLRGETWNSLQSPHRSKQALRALTGGLGGAAIIYGNGHMPLVDANAISLLNAAFLVALGVIVLGERLRKRHVVGVLLCVVGAGTVMAVRGAFSSLDFAYLLPAGVVLFGALLIAFEGLYIKLLSGLDRPLVTLAHANFFGMLLLAIPAALSWQSFGPVNFALLLLGPLAILGQFLNIRAYTLASVSLLAPLSYSSLIFAALFGWAFFTETLTLGLALGAALIAFGGIIIALSPKVKSAERVSGGS
jgi:drug/metabolite transporter (DMT)-like permease